MTEESIEWQSGKVNVLAVCRNIADGQLYGWSPSSFVPIRCMGCIASAPYEIEIL